MTSLSKPLRNELARTVLAARKLAEEAAGKALHTLGVDESDAPGHLDNDGRRLRIRLRAQAKQLGDRDDRQKQGCYEIRHLIEKIAYDHWHRLLFARFLAENDLLISPDHGVGISIDYCGDLAPEMGLRDGWEVAANFAARMLPQIFRADDPAGNVVFAPEDRVALRKLVTDLPRDIFLADDSLGWVYQFWQDKRKEEINKSNDKRGADEIAPVTQLFTEDYMVLFLLHNTLGAWWAGKRVEGGRGKVEGAEKRVEGGRLRGEGAEKRVEGGRGKVEDCETEEDCRRAVALPGVNWEYLRFIRSPPPPSTSDLPPSVSTSTIHPPPPTWLPAAGTFSGWPKTAKELRLLDPCMGSGHFVAAELPILVAMRMAEEGLSVTDAVEAVLRDNLFGLEIDPRCTQIAAFNLALAAWKLIGQYRQLPPLNLACCGLGINARKEDWVKLAGDDARLRGGMEQLFDLFQKAPVLGSLINPRLVIGDLLVAEFHELQPLLEKALAREEARRDETLAELGVTARGLAHAAEILAGQFTLVATNVPYVGFKKQDPVLAEYTRKYADDAKHNLATVFVQRCLDFSLCAGATAVVTQQNVLFLGSYKSLRSRLLDTASFQLIASLGARAFATPMWDFSVCLVVLSRDVPEETARICGIDAASVTPIEAKIELLHDSVCQLAMQSEQKAHPDCRISFSTSSGERLERYAFAMRGIVAGDLDFWIRNFWEALIIGGRWRLLQTTFKNQDYYTGRILAINWSTEGQGMLRPGSRNQAYGCNGVAICRMGEVKTSLYSGDLYDQNVATVVPMSATHLPAIWSYCSSKQYEADLRAIDQKLNITNATLVKVPFDLAHWQKVAAEKYPHGLPRPHSDDPTQWLFNGQPKGSTAPLQVAVARLLSYQWPRQTGSSFPDCPALEADGLEKLADADGIVCLNAIKGEQPAAEQLRALLAVALGTDWSATKQGDLLAQAGYAGKTLEEWLRNGFFEQHCQLFHQRPFIWQVWDGLRDGFSALVNYHRLAEGGGWKVEGGGGACGEDAAGEVDLHLSRRLDCTAEGGRGRRGRGQRRETGRSPEAQGKARKDSRRRGTLRHLRALEAAGKATHWLGSGFE